MTNLTSRQIWAMLKTAFALFIIAWHPCQYVDCKLEHDGSWVDGKWYEWEDVRGNREVARMKLDAIDHFYPHAKIIKEEDVCRYRELEEGEDNADH